MKYLHNKIRKTEKIQIIKLITELRVKIIPNKKLSTKLKPDASRVSDTKDLVETPQNFELLRKTCIIPKSYSTNL